MTYLEIVNGVLRRLREDQVGTINLTAYSSMVADFVNDAKKYVEGCWDWSANRQLIEVTTADGDNLYSLTGVGQDPEVIQVFDSTSQSQLRQMTATQYMRSTYLTTIPEGTPSHWAWAIPDASDDQQVNIYPTPDGEYDLKFWVNAYQADLSSGDDVLNIPSLPVILRSVAMLAEEKGETGGLTSARYFEMADKALSDAIAYDAGKYARETEWYVT